MKYSGVYKDGAEGKNDALFIMAMAEGAHKAWYTKGTIFDFSELKYSWGDEMSWVFSFGYDRVTRCNYPLSIVVSDKCSDALSSLEPDEYQNTCVSSKEEAVEMILRKYDDYQSCLRNWKPQS